jgi:hypothetical protein
MDAMKTLLMTSFFLPRLVYAMVFCAGLATGGFATGYLAIQAFPSLSAVAVDIADNVDAPARSRH